MSNQVTSDEVIAKIERDTKVLLAMEDEIAKLQPDDLMPADEPEYEKKLRDLRDRIAARNRVLDELEEKQSRKLEKKREEIDTLGAMLKDLEPFTDERDMSENKLTEVEKNFMQKLHVLLDRAPTAKAVLLTKNHAAEVRAYQEVTNNTVKEFMKVTDEHWEKLDTRLSEIK